MLKQSAFDAEKMSHRGAEFLRCWSREVFGDESVRVERPDDAHMRTICLLLSQNMSEAP
jgi:hypothetical protein